MIVCIHHKTRGAQKNSTCCRSEARWIIPYSIFVFLLRITIEFINKAYIKFVKTLFFSRLLLISFATL